MKYRLVMFDFDGTLADSFPWFTQVANTLADTHAFKRIEAHEIDTLRGYSARQMIKHLGVPWWKLPRIGRDMRRLTAENIDQVTLFDGVDRMLQQLSEAGVRIALVTSNSLENARSVLGPGNMACISHVECGASMFGKAARFRRVLKQSGVLPHQALSVGDELRDLEASRKVGVPFGAVAWGFTQIEALKAHTPAEVFTRVEDIVDRVM